MINFNQLRAFHEAAKTQNFSVAARNLHVTQPAVTAHIRSLEESLGVKLFRKRGRKVVLSDTGAVLFRYAHEVFELEKTMEQAVEEVRQLERGLLRIGTSKTYAQRLMPPLMTRFHASFPRVRMVLDEGSSADICRSLLELRNELALIARLDDVRGVTFVPFRREKVILFAAARHPLAQHESVRFEELTEHLVIMREEGSGIEALIRRSFEARGLQPNVLIETSNIEFIKEMVERGEAVSFLVESTISDEIERGSIRAIPIRDQDLTLEVSIAYLEGTDLSPAAQAFLALLLEEGDEAPAQEGRGRPASRQTSRKAATQASANSAL